MRETIKEVVISIGPLSIVIILLMMAFGGFEHISPFRLIYGMLISILGFAFFLIGIRTGLLQIGEMIGVSLAKTTKVWLLVGVFFVIGFSLTFAEPGVMVLSRQVDTVSAGRLEWFVLVFVIALGIGFFLALAALRSLFKWSMKPLFLLGYSIVFVLAFFTDPVFLPIAFDSSGVTTGPLTVPFILSLGVGLNSTTQNQKAVDSFGFVGLASIGPVIAVMVLGVFF